MQQPIRSGLLKGLYKALCLIGLIYLSTFTTVAQAQVNVLKQAIATNNGSGGGGVPTITGFNIPSGANRALFIVAAFERDHCDLATDVCNKSYINQGGLSDNFARPVVSTYQITARVAGPVSTLDKKNALTIGGSPSGDLRYSFAEVSLTDALNNPIANSTLFSLESYHIVLRESEINTLLGGASSGNVTITLPDVNLPKSAGDDAVLMAFVFDNVDQTDTGFVRSAAPINTNFGTGVAGNYTLVASSLDTNQAPDDAKDGFLVIGISTAGLSATNGGFTTMSGYSVLQNGVTSNSGGRFDNAEPTFITTEPDGLSVSAQFRNGVVSSFTLQSAAANTLKVGGGVAPAFTISGIITPPNITSNGGGTTAALYVDENKTAVTTVTASSENPSEILTYSIVGGTDAGKFSINASTGALTFTTAPNYESPTDSDTNNTYQVVVRVTDTNGSIDTQTITVTVNDVPDGLTGQTCSGYEAFVYDANTTLADNGFDGWTQPFNINRVGKFSYTEFANTNNWMSIQLTEWGTGALMTDGVGDDAGYTGTPISSSDWDRSAVFSRIITAAEAGNYRFNLVTGDDHVKIFKNGTLIYSKMNAYSGVPAEIFASYSLAANDQLTVVVIEENLGNTGLDLQITPLFTSPCAPRDFSDAPSSYGSAAHVLVSGMSLGSTDPDTETAAATSADAQGDDNAGTDDENGVFTNTGLTISLQAQNLMPEQVFKVFVPVKGTGKLYVWFDWDGDGTFGSHPDELVINGMSGTNQTLSEYVTVPLNAKVGTTFARFRWSSDTAAANPTGLASNGEVEDYQVQISAPVAPAPAATASSSCSTSGSTSSWVAGGGGYQSSTAQGLTITAVGTASSGAQWTFAPNDVMNTVGDFGNASINGVRSLSAAYYWDTTPESGRGANASTDGKTGTLTFNFSTTVTDPEIYIDRLGGFGGNTGYNPAQLSNSARFTPNAANAGVTFTKLGASSHFEVTSTSIQRTPNATLVWGESTGESGADSTRQMAMGGVKIPGTYSSISLDVSGVGVEGAGGDGMEFVICADIKVPPTITSNGGGATAAISIPENQTAVTTVTATDLNAADVLTYSISGGADAAKFAINASTGVLTFVAAPDYEVPTDSGANNIYDIQVTVSDGNGGTDVQAIAVTITDVVSEVSGVNVTIRAFLQGAYQSSTGLMSDTLRSSNLIPLAQPYTTNAFKYTGTETVNATRLTTTGNTAVVDWVLVELRDATTFSTIVARQAVLLLRNGDSINAAGASTLNFSTVPAGNYYVVVRHRNHLGVATQAPIALSTTGTLVDFTLPATATRGANSRLSSGTVALMWAGDVNNTEQVIGSGPNNDLSDVLGAILLEPTNTLMNTNFKLSGYRTSDIDMNGLTIFAGPGNDNNMVLGNILMHPANTTLSGNYIIRGGLNQ